MAGSKRGQIALGSSPAITRGQTALEFLTTYGWAILVLLAALSVMYYLGIFTPPSPNSCILPSGFACQGYKLSSGPGGSGVLTLDLSQTTGHTIHIVGLACSAESAPGMTAVDATLDTGQKASFPSLNCSNVDGSRPAAGDYYRGKLYTNYTDEDTGISHVVKGELSYRVEVASAASPTPSLSPSPSPTVGISPSPSPSPSPTPTPTPTETPTPTPTPTPAPTSAFTIDTTADFDAGAENGTATITQNPGTTAADTLELKNAEITPDANTVGLWHMDEGSSGTTADSSGNGNTGTISGATWNSSGMFGNSLAFNGSTDYVDVGNNPSLSPSNALTVTAWVKYNVINRNTAIYSNSEIINIAVSNSDNAFFYLTDVNYWVMPAGAIGNINNGQWHQLVFTYDSAGGANNMRVYADGILKQQTTATGTLAPTSHHTKLGVWADAYYWYDGTMDDVAIYNRSLSADEITARYNSGLKYHTSGNWTSATQTMPSGKQLYDLSLTVSGGGTSDISKVEVLDSSDNSVITTCTTPITANTVLTAADFDNGFGGTMNKNLKLRLYLVGDGASSIAIEDIQGRAQ